LPALKELNIGGAGMQGYGCSGGSVQLFGLIAMEMARFDSSIATFFGVHNGLAMGSIYLGAQGRLKKCKGVKLEAQAKCSKLVISELIPARHTLCFGECS
jgi:alkylation response protein AidB-like acyl-CoA dehydrogenase